MISKTYPLGSFERYPYVVILSRMEGKFLLRDVYKRQG